MATPRPALVRALRKVLIDAFDVEDLGDVLQVLDHDGNHVALVDPEDLAVSVPLGVVLMSEGDRDDLVSEAHGLLDQMWVESWKEHGFRLAPGGEMAEGEVVDEPGRIILSYERVATARPADLEALAALLAWVAATETEWVV